MKRFNRVLASLGLVVVTGWAAGCGATDDTADQVREGVDQVQSVLGDPTFSLPTIVIEIGEDGRPERIGGFDAEFVDDVFESWTGLPLTGRLVKFDDDYLRWLDRSGIQLVTFASRPEGLFVLVNGRPMPYLAWDGETFDNLEELLGLFVEPEDPDEGEAMFSLLTPEMYDEVRSALPVLKTVNLRVDVRFPSMSDDDRPTLALPDDDAFVVVPAAVERDTPPLQTVDLIIDYRELEGVDEGGRAWVPSLFGFSTVDLQAIAGTFDHSVPELRMREDIQRRIKHERIETVGVQARDDGMFLSVNGKLLPHLAWNEESLVNLTDLLTQLYPEGTDLPDDAQWVPIVRSTAPMYNDYALAVLVRFPLEERE